MKLRIKDIRKERKLTVIQLAEMAGISPSYLSELENAKKAINSRRLEAVARALDLSVYDLIDDASLSAEILDHIQRLQQLSDEDRSAVLRHAAGLLPKAS